MEHEMTATRDKPATTVISRDGTEIAFDLLGTGPALILVSSALSDRSDAANLPSPPSGLRPEHPGRLLGQPRESRRLRCGRRSPAGTLPAPPPVSEAVCPAPMTGLSKA
jgi:hypothetical protein